jgi:UDP-GlcNAc:undecaprenyl-phosphate GlcNAc-1-phosphate transferase
MLVLVFLLGFSALALALVLTPVTRKVALLFGFVDRPDLCRKLHATPTPRIGGVAVVLAYVGALTGVALITGAAQFVDVWAFLPAASVIFLVGIIDDLFGTLPSHKLAGEVLAALMLVGAGVHMTGIAGFPFPPWIGGVVTVIWLVGCTNAINLIDGVDGLACGIALLASVTVVLIAILDHRTGLALAAAPLVGALLGFLLFNFNPASVFLGDSGSLTIGFLLGCCGVIWSANSATLLGMAAPLMIVMIPFVDTSLTILRRFIRQQPIFAGDRAHIHHRLLARGLTQRRVVLILYAVSAVADIVSLLLSRVQGWHGAFILIVFVAAAIFGVRQLRYVEFGTAARMLLTGAFRRLLNGQISLEAFKEQLEGASDPDTCWQVIRNCYAEFGFSRVEMALGSSLYVDGPETLPDRAHWTILVQLEGFGYLELVRDARPDPPLALSTIFADALGVALTSKSFYTEWSTWSRHAVETMSGNENLLRQAPRSLAVTHSQEPSRTTLH